MLAMGSTGLIAYVENEKVDNKAGASSMLGNLSSLTYETSISEGQEALSVLILSEPTLLREQESSVFPLLEAPTEL